MDPNTVVLDISSDEENNWNGNERRSGEESNWLTELLGDDSDDVVVVKEVEKAVKKLKVKLKVKSSVVDSDDDDDDCVVLDEDPNACEEVRSDGDNNNNNDSDEIVVVSEKGQVACRDYPHSRHLCIKFPFSSTPSQSHCNQCYCYVCDSLAPCVYWGNGSASGDHCHATDKDEFWTLARKNAKNGGIKAVQPVNQLLPVDLYTAVQPTMVQPPNQFPKPGPIHANHLSANFRSTDTIGPYRNNILAPRIQLHPDLVSQFRRRAQQKYNQPSAIHRPVFKRIHTVRAATTAHQNRYSPYRGNLGNPIRQQSYQANGMLSGSSNYVGSLLPNAVNASVPYPPQSQTYTSSTVNQLPPPPPPPPPPQHQFSNQSNPNFQPHVNSNPIPENPLYRQPVSSQLTYMVPVQPSYHVHSKTQVDTPLVPVPDVTQNISQASQSQDPIVDTGFKDYGLGLPTGTFEGAGSATNESSFVAGSGGLADYQFDWIFDNQPIEPGFTDYSTDSAFIDTGPIFDF